MNQLLRAHFMSTASRVAIAYHRRNRAKVEWLMVGGPGREPLWWSEYDEPTGPSTFGYVVVKGNKAA